MYVISPWSKGGWVNSQVFDHTSVGQFLEKRFGIAVPGISPWHRAVCGDMTSAFDFVSPNDPKVPSLPDTRGANTLVAMAVKLPKPVAPDAPSRIFQERGSRLSRPLPYSLAVDAAVTGEAIALTFSNLGQAGSVFHVYDKQRPDRIPRRYTVEAGKELLDHWALMSDGSYDLWVLGPNGFLREFKGAGAASGIEARLRDLPHARAVQLRLGNDKSAGCRVSIISKVYEPRRTRDLTLKPGLKSLTWDVSKSGSWYDLVIEAPGLRRRFAGRLETGRNSISDPAMAEG
jgi:phospholipase C